MSPGLMRYFVSMGYDSKVLAADIVNMAVRGFLTIHYKPKMFFSGAYKLEKKETPHGQFEKLYRQIYRDLLGVGYAIQLAAKNELKINKAIKTVSDTYGQETEPWFSSSVSYTITGLIVGVICFYFAALTGEIEGVILFGGGYVGIVALFYKILKGYTPEGIAVKREVEGFKLFLTTAEEERLKIIGTPPTKTPELYETYLPYAIALGVEKQWSRQFAPLFEKMAAEGNPYTVVWISGGRFDSFNADSFASNISSSMGSSISSSSTPPGSSSGSGGRGSSGGGGGGGGGGGW